MKKAITVIATILVLVLILTGITRWVNNRNGSSETGTETAAPTSPLQPEWCPDVEVIAAPGTWESSAMDDPVNPTANPASYMLTITQPLQATYPADQVKVWTLPYTAQFRNINSMQEMSYDDSRTEGTNTLNAELVATHAECPLTDFILTGFSQGAVIVGDIANEIGTGSGVIPAERVRGVALVADGRRQNGVGQTVGNPVSGVGAEISLQPLNLVVQAVVPGATMRGERVGGFGELNDRVFNICAPGDSICDAPIGVNDALARAQSLIQPNVAHATYATNPDVIPGTTASLWIVDWAKQLIG
ncbi:cutinase family protein [Corynebacterium sp. SCR221107]|uniref:cutinase family protein n=1 Tax=Corynebacterium sp. SCR221107 TaxID=3017361 RepID=UPI0022EC5F27|nr:cutinase family protein [Corynebacterium sp. SCR221107]WBT08593.1 cutinase family protein [Corynebacterium sp. SCR221107]